MRGLTLSENAAAELGALVRWFRGPRNPRRSRRGNTRRAAASPRTGKYVETVTPATSDRAGVIKVKFDALRTDDRSFARAARETTDVYVLTERTFTAGERVECRRMYGAFDASTSEEFNRGVWVVSDAAAVDPKGWFHLGNQSTSVTTSARSIPLAGDSGGEFGAVFVDVQSPLVDYMEWADPLEPELNAKQGVEILRDSNWLIGLLVTLEITTGSGEALPLTGDAQELCDLMVLEQIEFNITLNDDAVDPTGAPGGLQLLGDGSNPISGGVVTAEKRCGRVIGGYEIEVFPMSLRNGDKLRVWQNAVTAPNDVTRMAYSLSMWGVYLGDAHFIS